MSGKKAKSHNKEQLKGPKQRKPHIEVVTSQRRVHYRPLPEMDTAEAIWEAHDDPC
jgi:hypothetical protein